MGHLADEVPDLRANPGASGPAGEVGPVAAEALAVPPGDRIGLDDQQGLHPFGPGATESDPERPIDVVELRPRPLPQERGHLLAKCQVLENKLVAGSADRPEDVEAG